MKACIIIKNKDERTACRNIMRPHFDLIIEGKDGHELIELFNSKIELGALVMDERCPETSETLEKIFKQYGAQRPFMLLMLADRVDNSPKAIAEESNRIKRYAEKGIELFIKRPSGLKDFEKKLGLLAEWAQKPPRWITLSRQAQILAKSANQKEVLASVEKMQSLYPNNVGLALTLVEMLMKGPKPQTERCIELLKKFEATHPKSAELNRSLIEIFKTKGDSVNAFSRAINLFLQEGLESSFITALSFADALYKTQEFERSMCLLAQSIFAHKALEKKEKVDYLHRLLSKMGELKDALTPKILLTLIEGILNHGLGGTSINAHSEVIDHLKDNPKLGLAEKISLLESLLQVYPDNADIFFELICANIQASKKDAAIQWLMKVRSKVNADPFYVNLCAAVMAKLHRKTDEFQALMKGHEERLQSPQEKRIHKLLKDTLAVVDKPHRQAA